MISTATLIIAEGESAGFGGNYSTTLIIIAVFIAAFYFLLIRPGQKQRKAHEQLVNSIREGDEIMSAGGIYGTVTHVGGDFVIIEVDEGTEIKLAKSSIARRGDAGEESEAADEDADVEADYEEETAGGDDDGEDDDGEEEEE